MSEEKNYNEVKVKPAGTMEYKSHTGIWTSADCCYYLPHYKRVGNGWNIYPSPYENLIVNDILELCSKYKFVGEVIEEKLYDKTVLFFGNTIEELEKSFQEKVETIIKAQKIITYTTEVDYSGNFSIRISKTNHKILADFAKYSKKTINAMVSDAIDDYINKQSKVTNNKTYLPINPDGFPKNKEEFDEKEIKHAKIVNEEMEKTIMSNEVFDEIDDTEFDD